MLGVLLLLALSGGLSESAAAGDPLFVDMQVGPVTLADQASGRAFVLRFGGQESEPDLGFAVFRYVNTGRDELLDLVMHPGGVRYEFMQFRIRRALGTEAKVTAVAGVESFSTGRGVHLGLTVEELIRVLGAPAKQSIAEGKGTLIYRCTSSTTCPTLKRVNMPEYEGKYSFRGGILVACEWGYPYP